MTIYVVFRKYLAKFSCYYHLICYVKLNSTPSPFVKIHEIDVKRSEYLFSFTFFKLNVGEVIKFKIIWNTGLDHVLAQCNEESKVDLDRAYSRFLEYLVMFLIHS